MLILLVVFTTSKGWCQQDFLKMPPPDTTENEEEDVDRSFTLNYSSGVNQFQKGNYSKAEWYFRKAFRIHPDDEGARYIYYSLLYQGLSLEADRFRARHKDLTFAIPKYRKGVESIYMDAGPRISANNNAGNMQYGDVGLYLRLSPRVRLWQAATYLQQDEDLGAFKQYEYLGAVIMYLKRHWYFSPTVHYDNVPYSFSVEKRNNVSYTASYPSGRRDTIVYKTTAVQSVSTNIPGSTHFINLSLPFSWRRSAVVFEAEPSLHYVTGRNTTDIKYTSVGTTDSFEDNRFRGSKAFYETGSSTRDSSYNTTVYQMGAAINYRLPLRGEPLSVRAAFYYLRDNSSSAFAYHVSASFWWNKSYVLYANVLSKGDLPLALRTEGQYFNFNDPIDVRAAISLQYHPLKHFSPTLTYQYEHDTRLEDSAPLVYHSIYLTLKYNL